jgi:uncharacterized membrane protein YphA (DoxX/SURF4 family)
LKFQVDSVLSIRPVLVRRVGKKGATTMANGKTKNVVLWSIQGVLAAVFLLAGGTKLVLPPEALNGPVALPVGFLRFIGLAEVAGAIGLILPGVLRLFRGLTPLAAFCLVLIMVGATVITLIGGTVGPSVIPLLVGTLAATVAYGRRDYV